MAKARRHYQDTRDPLSTIELIPKHRQTSVEVCLLKGVEKFGASNNLLAAINHVRRLLRVLTISDIILLSFSLVPILSVISPILVLTVPFLYCLFLDTKGHSYDVLPWLSELHMEQIGIVSD